MVKEPKIPMLPEQLPQQRLHEVVKLPDRPEPFDCIVGYGLVPDNVRGKGNPRSPLYLAQTEWAWSPMHSRIDAYYLQRGRKHWVLVTRYWDDNWGQWGWINAACVPSKGVTAHQAAVHLLLEFWKEEAIDSDLDEFHWINEAGDISVAELMAVAREVWG